MKCIDPVKLKEKNIVVPCGRCNFCLSRRRSDWTFRLMNEYKRAKSAYFLTLTYNDDSLLHGNTETGTLYKKHIMDFQYNIKRTQTRKIKKLYDEKEKQEVLELLQAWKIKYYTVGEYGTATTRPHYHTIMYNIYPSVLSKLIDGGLWPHGHVYAGKVTEKSINYTTKYIIDRDLEHEDQKPFSLMSKGLGANYLEKNYDYHKKGMKNYVMVGGYRCALPRYYRDKIFEQEEKELMAIKGIERADQNYFDALDRLEKFGVHRVYDYLKEQKQRDHDVIRIKSLKLNTL